MDNLDLPSLDYAFRNLRPEPWDGNAQGRIFVYEPLKSERHIRLLRITHFDGLQPRDVISDNTRRRSPRFYPCYEMVQVGMGNQPEYTAVSYVWGEPARNHV